MYLCTNEENKVVHSYISGTELFKIDPLAENAFYNFEASFHAYDKFYTGEREKIDLVMLYTQKNKVENNQGVCPNVSKQSVSVRLTLSPKHKKRPIP